MFVIAAAVAAEAVTLRWDPEAQDGDTWRCVTDVSTHAVRGDSRVHVETDVPRPTVRVADGWAIGGLPDTLVAGRIDPACPADSLCPDYVEARLTAWEPTTFVASDGAWRDVAPLSREDIGARITAVMREQVEPDDAAVRAEIFRLLRLHDAEWFARRAKERWYATIGHWNGRTVRVGAKGASARPTYPFPDVTRASWSVAPAECADAAPCVELTFTVVAPPPYGTMSPGAHTRLRSAYFPDAHEVRVAHTLTWSQVVEPATLRAHRTGFHETLELNVREHGPAHRYASDSVTTCLPAP